jgi:hypothetical protein
MSYITTAFPSVNYNLTLIGLGPVVGTSALFIVVQIIAIIVANSRILKVRPIIALKRVGE